MGPLLPAPSLPTISTWPGGASVPQAASDPRRSSSHFIGGSNPGAVSSSTRLSAAAIAQCAPAAPHRAYPARTMDTAAQMRSHDTAPVANHIKYINPLPIISASVSSPANMVVASRNPPPPRTTPVPSAALGQPVDVSPAHESTSPGSRSRDKRHGCTMCHKAFDRPSTLRKHLLVHTGEKAFSCETCGRRFGVLSNLNRHNRRCALRSESTEPPIETSDGANGSPQSQPISPPGASAESEATTETRATATLESSPVARRCRARAGSAKATVDAASSGGASTPRKRRARRAPSPSTWVPASLQSFDLTPVADACVLPLAPVLPYQSGTVWEERDSYDGDLSERPYHPLGWRGRLPGPGLREFITSGVSSMGRLVLS